MSFHLCDVASNCKFVRENAFDARALLINVNVFSFVHIHSVRIYPFCVLQCAAVCCSVLQCVAVCCSVLQCVAVLILSQRTLRLFV